MKRLIVLSVFALFVAGVVWAVRSLSWWALILGFLLLVLSGKLLVKRLVRTLILVPFRAKGAVLKKAAAQVHLVSLSGPSEESRDKYVVEVTIIPSDAEGPFSLWEPGELRLVRPESVLRPHSEEPDGDDDACRITRVQIQEEGQWKDDEGMKYGGAQRLRLHIASQEGIRNLKFRYYLEEFGNIKLSQGAPAAALVG